MCKFVEGTNSHARISFFLLLDPKFFDPKHIFKELPVDDPNKKLTIFQDPTKTKKVKAEGYADGEMSLYHKVNMTDFLNSEDPVTLLNNCSEVRLHVLPGSRSWARLIKDPVYQKYDWN